MAQNDGGSATNQAQTDVQKVEAQRQADAKRTADASRSGTDRARDRNRESVERERAERAERPQGVGGKPTPTQQENDEIRQGLRHINDKEHDGSPPDPLEGRDLRADELRRGYETR